VLLLEPVRFEAEKERVTCLREGEETDFELDFGIVVQWKLERKV
jgi:hypothetical protein